ncbi:hypothetical protein [Thermobrachium celere]|uniref:FIGfam003972: membrane protein n=1 Tax=Thermobrachium celere DSM 8682 TaxID=941824 RepID=R7RRL8_9CLOT|nr:hypothetical protein [Thermobrachium celere]CDF57905.1 FIGfam003972: membrane protein [Thermobrachium celere DSM 8682]
MEIIFFILISISFILFISKKYNNLGLKLIILSLLVLIALYPSISLNSAKEGLNLFLYTVFPSLFPFFVINDLMISVGIAENIAFLFNKPLNKIFKTSGYGAYAFIISIFSGYPAGAKVVRELIESKKISPNDGEKILTFSSTSGPLFIIGAVGTGMLKSSYYGYLLYIAHILGAILNGIFYSFFSTKKEYNFVKSKKESKINLNSSIKNSLVTMGTILGYIVLFSVIINLFDGVKLFFILATSISNLIKVDVYYIETLLKSIFEISNGCKLISTSNIQNKLILLSFILSFSGLSILYQVKGVLQGCDINFKKYVLSKISHGIFSSIVCFVICKYANISAFLIERNLNCNTIYLTSSIGMLILIFILNTISLFRQNSKNYF